MTEKGGQNLVYDKSGQIRPSANSKRKKRKKEKKKKKKRKEKDLNSEQDNVLRCLHASRICANSLLQYFHVSRIRTHTPNNNRQPILKSLCFLAGELSIG